MAGFADLLGSILQQGMSQTAGKRVGHALGIEQQDQSLEGLMGKLARQMETSSSGPAKSSAPTQAKREPTRRTPQANPSPGQSMPGLEGMLGEILGGMGNNKAVLDGLGSLLGSLLGGGGKQSAQSAVGGGGLAMLASLALSALQSAGQGVDASKQGAMLQADTPDRHPALEDEAEIIVRAMISAAKADGQISQPEIDKIVGKLDDDGLTEADKAFFMSEAAKPLDINAVVRSAGGDPARAAQIYAASFLAIEVDTAAEQQYIQVLAQGLDLHPEVARHIQRTLGVS